jgi:hypothetical protein
VRRALQRAEPGAQPRIKGDPRTGLLGAGFCPDFSHISSFALNARRAKREDYIKYPRSTYRISFLIFKPRYFSNASKSLSL